MKQRNPQIRKRCAFVRPIFYYFISISQLGIKATYCINYAELFSYVTQYKKSRELIRVDLGQKCKSPFLLSSLLSILSVFISVHLGNTF